jgi:methyl-accepting chemotaxis protein
MHAAIVLSFADYTRTFAELSTIIFARNELIKNTLDRLGPEIARDVENVKLDIKGVQDTIGPKLQAQNKFSIYVVTLVGSLALIIGLMLMYIIMRTFRSCLVKNSFRIL